MSLAGNSQATFDDGIETRIFIFRDFSSQLCDRYQRLFLLTTVFSMECSGDR